METSCVDELHAALFAESCTRGRCPHDEVGNPDPREFLPESRPQNVLDKRGMRGKGLRSLLGCQLRVNEPLA